MLQIIKNTNIDFIGKRKILLTISAFCIVGTVVLLFTKGLNYGIDFTGGAEVQLHFAKEVPPAEVRDTFEKGGFKNLVVQQLGEGKTQDYLVKFHGDDAELQQMNQRVETMLSQKMARQDFEIQRVDVVGPQAGGELRKSGFLSIFYTLICILIYVAIRFDFRYGPGAVAALIHDSVLTLGVFVLLQREFTLQTVAAILTIIGYSNNDTIIVFDRIRETVKNYPGKSLEENINRSINETLSRTILTSFFTLLVVTSLMIYGGGVIHDFAFTMFIGLIVGTYSSIFIAAPIMLLMTQLQDRGKKKGSGAVLGAKPMNP